MQFPCFRVLPDSAKALVRGDMLKHSIFWLRTFSVKFLSKIMLLLFMWLGAIICPPYPFTYPLPPFTVFFSIFYFFLFPFLLTSSIFLLFYLFPFYQYNPTSFPCRMSKEATKPGISFFVLILCYMYCLVKDVCLFL